MGEGPTDWRYLRKFAKKCGMLQKLMSTNPGYIPLEGSRTVTNPDILDRMHGSPVPFVLFRNKTKNPDDVINEIAAEVAYRIGGFNKARLQQIFHKQETYVESKWTDTGILNICPGKDLRRLISSRTLSEFGIELSVPDLVEWLDKVDEDIINLLTKITTVGSDISKRHSRKSMDA